MTRIRRTLCGILLLGGMALGTGCDAVREGSAAGISDGLATVISELIISSLNLDGNDG